MSRIKLTLFILLVTVALAAFSSATASAEDKYFVNNAAIGAARNFRAWNLGFFNHFTLEWKEVSSFNMDCWNIEDTGTFTVNGESKHDIKSSDCIIYEGGVNTIRSFCVVKGVTVNLSFLGKVATTGPSNDVWTGAEGGAEKRVGTLEIEGVGGANALCPTTGTFTLSGEQVCSWWFPEAELFWHYLYCVPSGTKGAEPTLKIKKGAEAAKELRFFYAETADIPNARWSIHS